MKVLITGASGGLGMRLSHHFNKFGYQLILISNKNSLSVKKSFPHHEVITIDFENDDISKKLLENKEKLYPDIIVHCAGGKLANDGHPIEINTLSTTLQINLLATIEINNFFINSALQKQSSLRIIHISSDAGVTGKASPSYSISKGALNTYIKNCGRTYAPNNIMLCGLICSIFEHEQSEWTKKKLTNYEHYESRKKSTTLQRFATVDEISDIIIDIAKSKNMLYSAELIHITAGNL